MDKYDTGNDHYCYPNSDILKNRLNIQEMTLLESAEREITSFTIQSIYFELPPYNLDYMRKLHRQLFSELYDKFELSIYQKVELYFVFMTELKLKLKNYSWH